MKTFFSRKGNVFIWHISFGYEPNKTGLSTWYKIFCDTYVLFMPHPKGRAAPFQITNQITSHFLFNYTFFSSTLWMNEEVSNMVYIYIPCDFVYYVKKKPPVSIYSCDEIIKFGYFSVCVMKIALSYLVRTKRGLKLWQRLCVPHLMCTNKQTMRISGLCTVN